TGDRVRWLAGGRLEFLGRADDQLKVRGFRIEPGEIETAVTGHPQVGAAVVTAHGQGGDRRLVAYLVPADPAHGIPAPEVLREHLHRSLPDYMIPSLFIELTALPMTPNGKINRAALPAPDASRAGLGGFSEPSGATEELLAGIWAQVLGVERVGATDGFFDLGGHSLLATLAVSRIREAFGVEVSLADLFDA
ncbi:phosphopantetheine-binding protein, partial [Streptomyces sp. SD11]|uniref:phosphopantetheine-binding protein n=1 Tax=Streptomyces sp. SD11 TaxID=3452209 RepID=UPI003F8AD29D